MRDRSKILIIIAAVILCAAMLSACGAAPQNEATAAEPAAVPSSTVEPTPEPEPELPAGCAVTVDGAPDVQLTVRSRLTFREAFSLMLQEL